MIQSRERSGLRNGSLDHWMEMDRIPFANTCAFSLLSKTSAAHLFEAVEDVLGEDDPRDHRDNLRALFQQPPLAWLLVVCCCGVLEQVLDGATHRLQQTSQPRLY